MASHQDYLPRKEAELVDWAENFVQTVKGYVMDLDIPDTEINALCASLNFFKSLHEDAKSSAGNKVIIEKIRRMVNFRLANPQVSGALRWQNEKGQKGPWSETQSAIVP